MNKSHESVQCFAFISVGLQDCPRASANISSLFIIETLSLDGAAICGAKDGCNTEHWVLESTYTQLRFGVALPRNELVYLSGPCQLNICLRNFLQFMKRGHIEESRGWEGSSLFTSSPAVGSCIF